jgi:hypothetical protein
MYWIIGLFEYSRAKHESSIVGSMLEPRSFSAPRLSSSALLRVL